jgi:hypothetical protein
VGYAEERVDGVAAAAVDDGAGGAEEGSAECGVGAGGLMGEEAVAPGLEELGVEVLIWVGGWLLFGGCEGGEGEFGGEGGCSGGGELEHLAAGEIVFAHRRNGSNCRCGFSLENQGNVKDGRGNGRKGSEGLGELSSSGSFTALRMTARTTAEKVSER